jgi:hypothetical protein
MQTYKVFLFDESHLKGPYVHPTSVQDHRGTLRRLFPNPKLMFGRYLENANVHVMCYINEHRCLVRLAVHTLKPRREVFSSQIIDPVFSLD